MRSGVLKKHDDSLGLASAAADGSRIKGVFEMSREEDDRQKRRWAAWLSLIVGFGMLGGKWSAFLLTGSEAILSDALESVVHVAATAFALMSLILGSKPPDRKYPYGYGKIGYFSAGFEGGAIVLAALAILYEAVRGLIQGEELKKLGLGIILISAAAVINLALGLWLINRGKQTRSLVLVADGKHVLADSYTSFGVVAGVGLVLVTKWNWLDGVVAILVALNILKTGYELTRDAYTGLMDRADPELLEKIVAGMQEQRRTDWIDIHHLRAWRAGDRVFVDFHMVVPENWTVGRLHEAHDEARDLIQLAIDNDADVNIHFDAEPADSPYENREPWTVEHAVQPPLHIRRLDRETEPVGR